MGGIVDAIFGGNDPPPAPDYAGAAAAQGQANIDAARATAKLSNPNVINPYGTQTVTYGVNGDQDQAQVVQTLSPEQKSLYDKSVQAKGLLGDLSVSGATALKDVIGQNLNLSGAPAAPGSAQATRDSVINAMMSRVNEDTANARDQANSDLLAAGIRPGTKAYADRMAMIDRGYNDARQAAITAGGAEASRDFGMDTQRRKDAIAEILAQRQTPLNEISALQSGSQVNNPFANNLGYQAGAVTQPAPIMQGTIAQGQADMNAYNAQQAGNNAMLGGLFSLGSAALGAPVGTFKKLGG